MSFIADLHIHSPYSRATSREGDCPGLFAWARTKGISVVGTGDFTHPRWLAHLKGHLTPAEPGLLRLKTEHVPPALPGAQPEAIPVRFLLSGEISSIYKRHGRVRKVHNLIFAPDFDTVTRINTALAAVGNIESDGRPILGLDSHDLLEILLEKAPQAFLVPAHIWTPWFSLFGSKSGFDSIEECFGDLAPHVFALETGLSSDPEMNRLISALDRFTLISNSDCHSPSRLGREANLFDTELDYFQMREALQDPAKGFGGTIEFYPEEGKYHLDGHRKCHVRLEPAATRAHAGLCPACGKPLTVGVLHRVMELADRSEPLFPEPPLQVHHLVPLPELIGECLDQGPATKAVQAQYADLIGRFGSEFNLLLRTPIDAIRAAHSPILAEAIERVRSQRVAREGGYDGEYGRIRVFTPEERRELLGAGGRFGPAPTLGRHGPRRVTPVDGAPVPATPATPKGSGPNREQLAAIRHAEGHVLVSAGPGTGKTHILIERIRHDLAQGIDPAHMVAITFTHRAAAELRERLDRSAKALPLPYSDQAATGDTAALTPSPSPTGGGEPEASAATPGLAAPPHYFPLPLGEGLGVRAGSTTETPATRLIFTGTCHAFALHWLRREATVAVVGDEHREAILRRLFPELSANRRADIEGEIAAWMETLNQSPVGANSFAPVTRMGTNELPAPAGIGANEFAPTQNAPAQPPNAEVQAYLDELARQNAVDLEQVIPAFLAQLDDARCARRVGQSVRHLYIDEFQDLNPPQIELVRRLAAHARVFAIGDPDQAIHGLRGADARSMERFAADFGAARLTLTRNYRSTKRIVAAAAAVIACNHPDDAAPPLKTYHKSGPLIERVAAEDPQQEADWIAARIDALLGGARHRSLTDAAPGIGLADCAVLYRLNHQAEALRSALERRGIPVQQIGAQPWFARPALRPALLWLRCAADPTTLDHLALAGCLPGLGAATQHRLEQALPLGFSDFFIEAERLDGEPRTRHRLTTLGRELDGFRRYAAAEGIAPALAAAMAFLGLDPQTHDAERLLHLAGAFGREFEAFASHLELHARSTVYDPRAEAVALMTMHAAKGLEFAAVIIAGCEEGLLPCRIGGLSSTQDEERRLFYVGMTRARERLILTHAARRTLFGRSQAQRPSPFLTEIPEQYMQVLDARRAPEGPKPQQLELF